MSKKTISFWGPFAFIGLIAILLAFSIDQAHKVWMLFYYQIDKIQPVRITSFFDLRLVWNEGVSYGWLKQLGPGVLIAGQSLVCVFLWFWVSGARDKFQAIATGIVIGGALGNIFDRISYGAVADFFHFHGFGYSWYVFNLADVAIVVGAAMLVYDQFRRIEKRD